MRVCDPVAVIACMPWMRPQVWVLARVSLQMYLAALWVFNFGAVMAWMPWMYRWHLQPDADSERAR